MERKKTLCYNYSFLISTVLPLLYGPLHIHVNLFNAVAGCRDFSNDRHRYIYYSGSNYSSYLSDMKSEKRDPTVPMQQLFAQGVFEGIQHKIPNAETFAQITYGVLTFKYDFYELDFRNAVIDILLNGQNDHMKKSEVDKLLNSAKKDEIATFMFNCFYAAVMCGNNTAKRIPRKSALKKEEQDTIREVAQMTAAEKGELRTPDNDNNN
ncbi:MAG: hypothetical protein II059_07085 [Clostridia bacterium]|nr:hypothetical protein [Clostridia bacterium]